MWRAIAAAAAFTAAAISGVLAGLIADDKSLGLWLAIGILIFVGAILQGIVTVAEPKRRTVASGSGAVAVGGNSRAKIDTRVMSDAGGVVDANGDTVASAPGSVGIGGDSDGVINTNVSSPKSIKE